MAELIAKYNDVNRRSFKMQSLAVPEAILHFFKNLIIFAPTIHPTFRTEDLLSVILLVVPLLYLGAFLRVIPVTAAIFPLYSLLLTLIFVGFSGLHEMSLIIAAKQTQYYLLGALSAIAMYKSNDPKKSISLFLNLILIACILSFFYSVFFGVSGYYGIDFWNEVRGPSNSTLAYLAGLLSAFTLTQASLSKSRRLRQFYFALTLVSLAIVTLVATRTAAVIGGFWMLIITWHIFTHIKKFLTVGVAITTIAIGLIVLCWFSFSQRGTLLQDELAFALETLIQRANTLTRFWDTLEHSRLFVWREDFTTFLNGNQVFGCGIGCAARSEAQILSLQADSQYIRLLREVGIIGSLLWAAGLLACWLRMRSEIRGVYTVFLLSFLLAGITQEVFLLSKGGQVFWLITGLFLGYSANRRLQR